MRDGSVVTSGQPLITLEDTQSRAILDRLDNEYSELLALEARLLAEKDNTDRVNFPTELTNKATIAKVHNLLNSQQSIFHANKTSMSKQQQIFSKRVSQLEEEINSLKSQKTANVDQLALIAEETEAVAYLESKKIVDRPRLLGLHRETARLEGSKGRFEGLIAKARQQIGETQLQKIYVVDEQQQSVLTELRDTQRKLADIKEERKIAADILTRTHIFAPKSGIVTGLQKHTVGGVITPGQAILDIVPDTAGFIIEANIDPMDIDVVHPGLTTKLKLSAFKQRSTPTIDGLVEHVSADIFTDENSGQSFYKARISLPKDAMEKLKPLILYPGMPVMVMIITSSQTPFDYFITPIKDSFDKAFRES